MLRQRQLMIDQPSTNTAAWTQKYVCLENFFPDGKTFSHGDGTAKRQEKVAISLFVKTNGLREFAIKRHINARYVLTENYCRYPTEQFIIAGKDEYGRDVIGIYPMLPDDTCRFLCADFDDAEFEKDVAAYRSVCEGLNLSVSVERSRSGNGAHAWLFFEEAVPADLARKMGTIILTKAMRTRP